MSKHSRLSNIFKLIKQRCYDANRKDFCNYGARGINSIDVEEAFLAGLKAGRPEWHDLRKNPDDLPKRLNFMSETVVNQIGTPCHYNYEQECWQNWSFIEIETPIAWCEIPKFEDKE